MDSVFLLEPWRVHFTEESNRGGDVKRGEPFLISNPEHFSFSYKYCHYLILQFKLATAIKSASRCFAKRNYFSTVGFLAL